MSRRANNRARQQRAESLADVAGLIPEVDTIHPGALVKHRVQDNGGVRTDYRPSDLRPIHALPEAPETPDMTRVHVDTVLTGRGVTFGFLRVTEASGNKALTRCRCGVEQVWPAQWIAEAKIRSCGDLSTHGK